MQGYDCSGCDEGGRFATAESISTSKGGYDLLSKDSVGKSPPISVLGRSRGGRDGSGLGGGLLGLVRTENYLDVAVMLLIIIGSTGLCGHFLLRRSMEEEASDDEEPNNMVRREEATMSRTIG